MNTTATTTEKVLIHLENNVKTITINNPKSKNSVSPEMGTSILKALGASKLDGTRVIVITGAEGNFCSGADLTGNGMQNPKQYDVTTYLRTAFHPLVLTMRTIDIPIIAKVRGVAAGIGANFALAADMVYASENAMFSQIFTNIALSSDGGGAYWMVEALGYKKAFELMVKAAKISAADAEKWGMVNQLCKDEDLDAQVDEMVQFLATGPFVAIQKTKANLREALKGSIETTLEAEANNQLANFQTDDFIEGVMAFMQKRKPQFKGK
ncbi:MAG: hypothetical protein EAZ55_05560 [Cytophagales bacterium]|nr:MAG: hypothetical protein EAZ55_05560 [Cytophagales bacterium]